MSLWAKLFGKKEKRKSGSQGDALVLDDSVYTKYPDVSLQSALTLISRHGRPAKVVIVMNHQVQVFFRDGTAYGLGGFTVGYRGTGPDYTKRLLNAAGFSVSIDEVAEMTPPVTFTA